MIRGLGWRRDDPKHLVRCRYGDAGMLLAGEPPPEADLSNLVKILDQGGLGCHDEKTEVLTEKGWTPWPDYDGTDLLGTVNPVTRFLEFQAPTALQAFEYKGPLHKIDHASLDFALTPNHRMFQRSWIQPAVTLSSEFTLKPIAEIGWYAGLLAAPAGFQGVELEQVRVGERSYAGDDFLALLALVASDGWTGNTFNTIGRVSFCCFREDRLPMVREFASRMGWHDAPKRPGVWVWQDAALAAWLRANLYVGNVLRSPFKRVPEIVKSVSARQIEHFLRFYGDQHCKADGSRQQFYTASRYMVNDLQELHLRLGRRTGVYERPPRSTTMRDGRRIHAENCTADLTLTVWDTSLLSIERKRQMYTEDYNGVVYCATVPNSTLVTRRNGTVLISGNSCVAQSVAQVVRARQIFQGAVDPPFMSRLMTYWLARKEDNATEFDWGTYISTAFDAISRIGFCDERHWPYFDAKDAGAPFRFMPPAVAFQQAFDQRGKIEINYHRITTSSGGLLLDVKRAVAAGHLVAFGTQVSRDFASNVLGSGPIPPPIGQPIAGGHAMGICGYDREGFRIVNSWSEDWGDRGFCDFAPEYITWDATADFWIVTIAPVYSEMKP